MGVATYRDHLASVKREIHEISPKDAAERLASEPRPVLLDVRERDEWEQGHIPGAIHIPRGNLESRIDNAVSDRAAPLIVYCAAGNRSAYAAKTLAELGFSDVLSMSGGFTQGQQDRHQWKTPRTPTPPQVERYSRHTLLP